jgi:formylglycine-generating enzyme required for sulfatase activity
MPDGRSGFVYGEHLRKVAVADAPATAPPSGAQEKVAVAPRPPAANPPAAPAAREFRDCEQCPSMVRLPGGQFEMGSLADASERPPHRVQLAGFALGKYEVTQGEWKACVAAGACSEKARVGAANDRLPMMDVSWDDATKYAQWLRGVTGKPYRLPSEAEWEYAARAGVATPYPWGKEVGVARANCRGCGGTYDTKLPAAVGSFPPNAWGLHDMQGGVAEWTEDCWHKSYEGAPTNGSAWQGPRCAERVLRGGSWKNPPGDLTVSSRNFYDASVRYIANGLRVAVTLP